MEIAAVLTHRALHDRAVSTVQNGKRITSFVEWPGVVRCFLSVGEKQDRQQDATPTKPGQHRGTLYARHGVLRVGDRLRLTRPAEAGTWLVRDLQAVHGALKVSHDEAIVEQVEQVGE